ncbi:hypothetical protein KC867_03580, partial [Candidatus Saccharibacteria bacterium]|nr:hypothetical protein [Candidatus Saccharibacteria bacterium]
GEKITLTQAFSKGYTYFVKLLALSFICGLIIVLGFVCLIVPGIIALKKLILAPYCLVAEDVTITEAMKMSASLSDKNSGAIYGLLGISLLFALAGSVLEQGGLAIGGVISAILSFLYSLAPAIRYEQMKNVYGK